MIRTHRYLGQSNTICRQLRLTSIVPLAVLVVGCLMSELDIFKYFVDFLYFVAKALYDVPLEISIGTAIILTFIWLTNEIFGRLSLWRTALITVWALVLVDLFLTPLKPLGAEYLWLLVLVVGVTTAIAERKLRHSLKSRKTHVLKCPHCGTEFDETSSKKDYVA
jgi:hypothetical protein